MGHEQKKVENLQHAARWCSTLLWLSAGM